MKKAVLYARVSSDLQKKERTIDSQIAALKKQVADAGHVLVKEYVDDGYSGARLDRPALDQLRKDVRTGLFDTIYFLNADRIARDVVYQNIIIAEILKHRKQIIINGKDYVHNPENKFTLTVLGAVAELERAKITERATRGRQMRLAQGHLLGLGYNTYGYDYVHKTPTSPARLVVNPKEAAVVRYIFTEFAKGQVGMRQITRRLEEQGHLTKKATRLWRVQHLKTMLQNETYAGVKYFNKIRKVREYGDPASGVPQKSVKYLKRDRGDWVGIKVPAIIPRPLFDEVQARLAWNKQNYRSPKIPYLLSSLVRCGYCGGSFYAYRRYLIAYRKTAPRAVYHKMAYKCNWRLRQSMHAASSDIERCYNKEIKTELLEAQILAMIETVLLDPAKLRASMDFSKDPGDAVDPSPDGRTTAIDRRLQEVLAEKRSLVDLYVLGDLQRALYTTKTLACDSEITELTRKRKALVTRQLRLHTGDETVVNIAQYCDMATMRFGQCVDFATKRQFLVDYIEKIVFWNDRVAIHGSVPIGLNAPDATDHSAPARKIPFCIEDRVTRPTTAPATARLATVNGLSGTKIKIPLAAGHSIPVVDRAA